jgi:hypothetical protein
VAALASPGCGPITALASSLWPQLQSTNTPLSSTPATNPINAHDKCLIFKPTNTQHFSLYSCQPTKINKTHDIDLPIANGIFFPTFYKPQKPGQPVFA